MCAAYELSRARGEWSATRNLGRIGNDKSDSGIPERRRRAGSSTSRQDRQSPDPESLVLDEDDGAAGEFRGAVVDHLKKSWIHRGRRLISQPKDDDARSLAAGG